MKFDCGETRQEWIDRLSQWHDFYAIWPRKVAAHDCRVFETIERRGRYWAAGNGWFVWEYRAKNSDNQTKE